MSAIESLLNRLEEKITPAELVRNVITCDTGSCFIFKYCTVMIFINYCPPAGVISVRSERGRKAEAKAGRAGWKPK